jgi:hypothetical protein
MMFSRGSSAWSRLRSCANLASEATQEFSWLRGEVLISTRSRRHGAAIFEHAKGFSVVAPDLEQSDHTSAVVPPALIRNVAVIAHVDHGKTTLMDRILRHCGASVSRERAMDSISLERERGITIASKVCLCIYLKLFN